MKNFWKGKLYLKFENHYPWYIKGPNGDMCVKKLLQIGHFYITIRVNNTKEIKDKYVKKLLTKFDFVEGNKAIKGKNVYFLVDCPWIIRHIDDLEPTEHGQVFYNKKHNSYIGFSHRSAQEFKIGDKLFIGNKIKNIHQFYCDKKLRWRMLKTLLKYHFKNDVNSFEDIFEDNIIGHGISLFIPFKNKGEKNIETKEEAYQAAYTFAKYVS